MPPKRSLHTASAESDTTLRVPGCCPWASLRDNRVCRGLSTLRHRDHPQHSHFGHTHALWLPGLMLISNWFLPASPDPALHRRATQILSDHSTMNRKSSHRLPGSLNSSQPAMNLTYRVAHFLRSTHFRALSCQLGDGTPQTGSLFRKSLFKHTDFLCVCFPHLSPLRPFPHKFCMRECFRRAADTRVHTLCLPRGSGTKVSRRVPRHTCSMHCNTHAACLARDAPEIARPRAGPAPQPPARPLPRPRPEPAPLQAGSRP